MSEILYGIRVLKFHSWEHFFMHRVARKDGLIELLVILIKLTDFYNFVGIREKELKNLKGRKYLDALCVYFWATTPVLVSVLSFGTYVLLGNELTAAKVNP
jgi:ATP-binding cassette subfamily C (CFTR/MRP) protein 10